MGTNYLLELKDITKKFPGVLALDKVNFQISAGEIVSLMGANGAGKSTLSNIISGADVPSEGQILVDGRGVSITDANIAEALGIEMVHQEPTLVANMTVTNNIFLNRELKKGILLDADKMRREVLRIFELLGFSVDPDKRVVQLTLVEKTAVEIAKALLSDPRLLILDEVTAPLDDKEVERLFKVMRELKSKGIAMIFIDHKIQEVVQIVDRVVVLRDGKNAGELEGEDVSERAVIDRMLGTAGKFTATVNDQSYDSGAEAVLRAEGLSNKSCFSELSFELKKGEILGFAGLKGAGVTELFKTIFGLMPDYEGKIVIHGEEVKCRKPEETIGHGIGFISNDRQKEGLALIRSVCENIAVSTLKKLQGRGGTVSSRKINGIAAEYVEALQIKTPSNKQLVRNLSGGNQQKIVIAKWLARNLDILMFDEPTRGVDIKAKNEIYRLMMEQKRQGKAIMVASPEIPELMSVCDRILIVVQGRILGCVHRYDADFNENAIMEMINSEPVQ